MFSTFNLRVRVMAIVFGAILILISLSFLLMLQFHEHSVLRETDAKLLSAAQTLKFILPADYHDRITNAASVSFEQYERIAEANNRLCREQGLQYVWSVLVLGPRHIVFTSATSPYHDVRNQRHAGFFETHTDPEAFILALQTMKPCFSTYMNQWGRGRMVLIPETDRQGRVHMFGSSMSMDVIDGSQHKTLIGALVLLVLATAIAVLVLLHYFRILLTPVEALTQAAEAITQGDYDTVIPSSKGSREEVLLAQSLDAMRRMICKQMAALQESEQQFRLLVSSTHAMIYKLRASDYSVLYVSDNVAPLLGHTPRDFTETPGFWFDHVHPEDRGEVMAAGARLASGSSLVREYRFRMADGRYCWVQDTMSLVPAQQGHPPMIAGYWIDITQRQEVAEALRVSRDRLEQAKKLTRESRKLTLAKEAAEAASHTKSAFLASMSHEVRTPMNAILGFSQLLLGDPELNTRQRKQIESINRSGKHLLGLINDILDMAKLEAGQMTVNWAGTNVHTLLHDLETMFKHPAEQKRLELKIEASSSLPRAVITDPKKLMLILINLTGNAVKFTSAGGVTVRMAAESDPHEALQLHVEVEDTGPGISEEARPRLFERFEKILSGRDAVAGSGLGLAISRGLARLMGGEITVRSQPGRGSVFTLVLPVKLAESPAPGHEEVLQRGAGLPPDWTQRRILVVDDIAVNCEILVRMLARVGFEIQAVNSGVQGVELASSWGPDLILMDLRMPGMSGLDAIRQIREQEQEKGKRIPIMAITASVLDEQCAHATQAGADDFILKPFLQNELLQKIGTLLGIRYVLERESPEV